MKKVNPPLFRRRDLYLGLSCGNYSKNATVCTPEI
nr:MAG TPA: hypothetical protein [Caudoviricetes sp.]